MCHVWIFCYFLLKKIFFILKFKMIKKTVTLPLEEKNGHSLKKDIFYFKI